MRANIKKFADSHKLFLYNLVFSVDLYMYPWQIENIILLFFSQIAFY